MRLGRRGSDSAKARLRISAPIHTATATTETMYHRPFYAKSKLAGPVAGGWRIERRELCRRFVQDPLAPTRLKASTAALYPESPPQQEAYSSEIWPEELHTNNELA